MSDLKKNILTDLKVELLDEFDQNFTRKAFFDQPWPKRIREGKGSLMQVSGRGRRSIRGEVISNGVRYFSDTEYMGIHNRGGKIKVTPKMRHFFWAQYYKYAPKGNAKQAPLSADARFWKNMALSKKTVITIPKRQVIGDHRRVGEIVNEVVNNNLKEYMQELNQILKNKLYKHF